MAAAIFNDINPVSSDIGETVYTQAKDNFVQNFVGNVKDFEGNSMNVMFDTGVAIRMYHSWCGEHFHLTNTAQKVTSASSADWKLFGRRTIPLMFEYNLGCCLMAAFLVCGVTTPT